MLKFGTREREQMLKFKEFDNRKEKQIKTRNFNGGITEWSNKNREQVISFTKKRFFVEAGSRFEAGYNSQALRNYQQQAGTAKPQ